VTRVAGDDATSWLSSTTFGGAFSTLSAVLSAHEFCQPSHYSSPEGSNSAANVQRNKNLTFYPRDAMLARVIEIATCPSVRPSRAGIVSKRRKLAA